MGQIGSKLILNIQFRSKKAGIHTSKELQKISNFQQKGEITIADAKWTGQLSGEQLLPTKQDKSDDQSCDSGPEWVADGFQISKWDMAACKSYTMKQTHEQIICEWTSGI